MVGGQISFMVDENRQKTTSEAKFWRLGSNSKKQVFEGPRKVKFGGPNWGPACVISTPSEHFPPWNSNFGSEHVLGHPRNRFVTHEVMEAIASVMSSHVALRVTRRLCYPSTTSFDMLSHVESSLSTQFSHLAVTRWWRRKPAMQVRKLIWTVRKSIRFRRFNKSEVRLRNENKCLRICSFLPNRILESAPPRIFESDGYSRISQTEPEPRKVDPPKPNFDKKRVLLALSST